MTGFLISAMAVFALVALIWLLERAMDGDKVSAAGVCLLLFLILGAVISYAIKSEAKGPCHE